MNTENLINCAAKRIPPSGIRRFFDLAASKKGCISLGVGEPDFKTPLSFSLAGVKSILKGKTHYTENAGLYDLRRLVAKYEERLGGIAYSPDNEILITVGASEGIDLAIRAICNAGDEIIVPTPNFVCYKPLVELAGGVPKMLACSPNNGFKIDIQALESQITPKTKAIILAYPNNPTGVVQEKNDLKQICDVIKKHDMIAISDEIYGDVIYGENRFYSPASFDGMRDRTIVISGFSKYFAMTGWRIGYVCAEKNIMQAMLKIHQYSLMCAATQSQYTAIQALETSFRHDFKEVKRMVATYEDRRNFLVSSLKNIGFDCPTPKGTFYLFLPVDTLNMDGNEFAYSLLNEKNVAVVPGNAFGNGGENFVRLSFATSKQKLKAAALRINEFVSDLNCLRKP